MEGNALDGLVGIESVSVKSDDHIDLAVIGYEVLYNNVLFLSAGRVYYVFCVLVSRGRFLTDDSGHVFEV